MRKNEKILILLVLFGVFSFFVTACNKPTVEPTEEVILEKILERDLVIQSLLEIEPKNKEFQEESKQTEKTEELCVSVILQDTGSMIGFLDKKSYSQGENTYVDLLNTLYNIAPMTTVPKTTEYYRLSQGAEAEPELSHLFLENAKNPSVYWLEEEEKKNINDEGNHGISPLTQYMQDFFSKHYSATDKQLFILVCNLTVSGETDGNGIPVQLVDTLSRFVNSRTETIGVIGIQAAYYQSIMNLPSLKLDGIGNILEVEKDVRKVRPEYVNYGNAFERPMYILLMGDTDAVHSYMVEIKKTFPNAEKMAKDGDYKEFVLDDARDFIAEEGVSSNEKLELLTPPEPNDILSAYALPLVGYKNFMSDSAITGNSISWDTYLNDNKDSLFWRLSDRICNETESTNDVYLSLDISNFAEFTPEIGEIRLLKSVVDKDSGEEKVTNIWLNTRQETDKYVIPVIDEDDDKINFVIGNLKSLERDDPVFVVAEIMFKRDQTDESYQVPERSSNMNWLNEWTLDLMKYRIETYDKTDSGYEAVDMEKAPKEMTNIYTQANKTPFLRDLFNELFKTRSDFISNAMREQNEGSVRKYVVFGFVIRARLIEYNPGGGSVKPEDNGGFAFSDNEYNALGNPSNTAIEYSIETSLD